MWAVHEGDGRSACGAGTRLIRVSRFKGMRTRQLTEEYVEYALDPQKKKVRELKKTEVTITKIILER